MLLLSTLLVKRNEPLAQLVEHLTFNQRVEGSSPSWLTIMCWPVGQAVKTPPFHGGNTGSNPVRVIYFFEFHRDAYLKKYDNHRLSSL